MGGVHQWLHFGTEDAEGPVPQGDRRHLGHGQGMPKTMFPMEGQSVSMEDSEGCVPMAPCRLRASSLWDGS